MSRCRNHSDFVKRIAGRRLAVLSRYRSAKEKVRLRCLVCGNEWRARPDGVGNAGTGCPKCANIARGNARRKQNNVLKDHGCWLEIDISTLSWPGATMKIDTADWQKIRALGRVSPGTYGYPCVYNKSYTGSIHRLLIPDAIQVDHINHDTADARRSNLRACTASQNHMNTGLQRNSTSGHPGVCCPKRTGTWVAYITVRGRRIHLGSFVTKAAAVTARQEAEDKYFGEFSRRRSAARSG